VEGSSFSFLRSILTPWTLVFLLFASELPPDLIDLFKQMDPPNSFGDAVTFGRDR